MPQVLSESGSEEEIPSKPLSENKLSSMESAITPTTIEQDVQPAKPEESALLESKQQVTSIESLPQTIINPSIPPPQPLRHSILQKKHAMMILTMTVTP